MNRMLIALVLVLAPLAVAAQQPADAVTVDLGTDAVLAGEKTSLSVVLATDGDPKVGKLHFDVIFPTAHLTFVKLSNGAGVEAADGQVKTEIVKPEGATDAILKVDISAPRPIPQGGIVSLMFEVDKKAPPEIRLKAGGVAASGVAGHTLAAKGVDGLLNVLTTDSMAFACFFYMH